MRARDERGAASLSIGQGLLLALHVRADPYGRWQRELVTSENAAIASAMEQAWAGERGPVYATDPDAFTEPWYQRRAAAYADDARKIVAMVEEYEDIHPDDAPCLLPLANEIGRIAWRGHDG